jgi:acyl carrier protein
VKIRGYRIEVGEIEAVLREYGGVEEAAVVVREGGKGGRQLVVCYTGERGKEELKRHLSERLPRYMVPESYVKLEELPLNRSGKVDREGLGKMELEDGGGSEEWEREQTAVEEIVVGIWKEVLGVEQVGLEEEFFRLGGHSLLATQVMSRVREVFGVEVELRRLFENPTVRALAEEITQKRRVGRSRGEEEGEEQKIERRSGSEAVAPLSYAQQRLWFLEQLRPGTPLYHIPVVLRLRGRLEVAALEASMNEIVRRHEVLRTGIELLEGRPLQRVHPYSHLPLPITDLSSVDQKYLPLEIDKHIQREIRALFCLYQPPLFRLRFLRLSADDHLLVLTMHHIISDGWSMGLFVKELTALYSAFSRSEQSPLPELALQYADYSVWQHELSERGVWQYQMSYWKKQLAEPLPILELSFARPRPHFVGFEGSRVGFEWPANFLIELNAFSNRHGVTLFMTLLAALNALLHRYTGQTDIVLGTVIANRNRLETEQMIGFFLNLLALRTRLEGNPTFAQLLDRTRETTLDAYACQDVPFEKIVEEVHPVRDLSRSPIFQVLLVLQNAPMRPLELPGLTIENMDVKHEISKFDLSLYFREEQGQLRGSLEYNPELFGAASAERMVVHLQRLLSAAIQDPSLPVSDIQFMAPEEQWNIALASSASAAQTIKTLPEHGAAKEEQGFAAPVTATQNAVAEIWKRVLELEEVSIHQKFFEIGGDSIRLVQVFLALNQIYPDKFSVSDLFSYNTVASLSARIDAIPVNNVEAQPALQTYEL